MSKLLMCGRLFDAVDGTTRERMAVVVEKDRITATLATVRLKASFARICISASAPTMCMCRPCASARRTFLC